MSVNPRSFLRSCLILLLASVNLWSQQLDNQRSTGSPSSVYYAGEIDQVDLSSGNLRISIPLLQLPGRGLGTDIVLTYNSKIWKTYDYYDPFIGMTYVTSVDDLASQRPALGWGLGVPRMGVPYYVSREAGYNMYNFIDHWVFVSSTGSRTPLVNTDGWLPYGSPMPTEYWSTDNSYVRCSLQSPMSPSWLYTCRYKDGVTAIAQGSGNILKDTNGNTITCTDTACTDTLGRTINVGTTGVGYVDSSGFTQTISFEYTTFFVCDPVTPLDACPLPWAPQFSLLTRVRLPDGRSYSFEYVQNANGSTTAELNKITLPAGGYIRYTYDSDGLHGQTRAVKTRTVSTNGTPASENIWTYSINLNIVPWGCPDDQTTVTDPLGNIQKLFSTYAATWYPSGRSTEYRNSIGGLLRKVDESLAYDTSSYNNWGTNDCPSNPRVWRTITVLSDTNQQSKRDVSYGSFGNPVYTLDYGFGAGSPGSLIRRTYFEYLADLNPPYASDSIHILDRVTLKRVQYPSGYVNPQHTQYQYTTVESTQYSYDTNSLSPTANVPGHDPAHNSSLLQRGNLTQISRWLNTNGAWLSTLYTYDDLGNRLSTSDPGGHTTTLSYADDFSDGINRNTQAYLTQITYPTTGGTSHVERKRYYYTTGFLYQGIDQNNQVTTYSYDGMNRLSSIVFPPEGGQTTYSYNDPALPIKLTTTQKITDTLNLVSETELDGLGRTRKTKLASDPQGPIYNRIQYDALRRKQLEWNPTRCDPDVGNCGEPSYGITEYQYDSLGRARTRTHQDGNLTTTEYSGNCTRVTDPQGHQRVITADALGRFSSVYEVTAGNARDPGSAFTACGFSGTGYLTSYAYDVLGNLTGVTQGSQTRSFVYDSLSRLASARNPESGTATYTYDADGNLLTKTDARGTRIAFSYDVLHRVLTKTYSDSTPPASFCYDNPGQCGLTGISNPVGRLIYSSTDNPVQTAEKRSYDAMGRVRDFWQCTPQNCSSGFWQIHTVYSKIGGVESYSNGVGVTLTQVFDSAGLVTQIDSSLNDLQHPGRLASGISYAPFGALTGLIYGNGMVESRAYNPRLQPASTNAIVVAGTGGNALDMGYDFRLSGTDSRNNGNVMRWTNTPTGAYQNYAPFVRQFQYDDLNRLCASRSVELGTTAWQYGDPAVTRCTTQGSVGYDYDRYGNRWSQLGWGGPAPQFSFNGNNQINSPGFSYDLAGNMTSDGSHIYQYDAENRLTRVDGGAATYLYNSSGQRVQKNAGGTITNYLYSPEGNVLSEINAAGVWVRGYVYLNGQLVAQYADSTTYFVHKDHLGSTRLLTKLDQSVQECDDYYPFGEMYIRTGCTDGGAIPHKFTGKERDTESNLDNFGARYFGSRLGRFTSPDPLLNSGRPSNPQTWNRYPYAFNNPLAIIDPTGLYNLLNNCAMDDNECNKRFQQNAKKLKKGLSDLQKKVDKMKDGTEKTRLQNALKALGTENDGNNVNVKFDALSGSAAGNTETVYDDKTGGLSFNVTFDPRKISGGTDSWAIDAAHEGTHVADISDPRFANPTTTLDAFQQEYRPYQTSAWAAQALGVASLSLGSNVIWNSSWAEVDRQTLMDKGITQHVTSIPGHREPKPPIPHNPWPN